MEGQRAEKAKGGVGGRIPCVPWKAVVALLWAPWQQGTAGLPQNVSIHLPNKTPEQGQRGGLPQEPRNSPNDKKNHVIFRVSRSLHS